MKKKIEYGEFPSWDDVRNQLFTKEEIVASDLRVALICELIEARKEQGITQKKLEEMTGIKQPVIARLESGDSNAKMDTILKILASLGKTLKVVPMEQKGA